MNGYITDEEMAFTRRLLFPRWMIYLLISRREDATGRKTTFPMMGGKLMLA